MMAHANTLLDVDGYVFDFDARQQVVTDQRAFRAVSRVLVPGNTLGDPNDTADDTNADRRTVSARRTIDTP